MKKARVLFLTLSPQDYQGAGGRTRIVSEIRYAIRDRYAVTVLCLVSLRKWLRPLKLRGARRALGRDAGVPVLYLPKWSTFGLPLLRPLAAYMNRVSLGLVVRLLKPVIVHSHGAAAGTLALGLKRPTGGFQVVADLHGVDSAEYRHREGLRELDARGQQILQQEKDRIEQSDAQVIVSKALRAYYEEQHGLRCQNAVLLPCLTRAAEPLDLTRIQQKRRALGLGDKLVCLYLGSYRAYQMVEETILAFQAIAAQFDDAFFLILTSHRTEFEAALEKYGIAPAQYRIETAQQAAVHEWIQLADLGFMLRADELVNRVASPTKFAEYLINGVPVITTPHVGDFSALVEEHRLGYRLKAAHVEPGLFDFIASVKAGREAARTRCQAFACSELSWEQAGHRLPDSYDKLLQAEPYQTSISDRRSEGTSSQLQ